MLIEPTGTPSSQWVLSTSHFSCVYIILTFYRKSNKEFMYNLLLWIRTCYYVYGHGFFIGSAFTSDFSGRLASDNGVTRVRLN